jgi:hypothetical protein
VNKPQVDINNLDFVHVIGNSTKRAEIVLPMEFFPEHDSFTQIISFSDIKKSETFLLICTKNFSLKAAGPDYLILLNQKIVKIITPPLKILYIANNW